MKNEYLSAIPADWADTARLFEALGDPHRQRLLLAFEPGERLNAGQLASVSVLGRSTVSHHLKMLREAGVLKSERVGKEVFYWIDKGHLADALRRVLAYVEENT